MDIKLTWYFREICRCGSYSRAALACGISTQGISAAVKRMESELGCTLIETGTDGSRPTLCGEYFLDFCNTVGAAQCNLERQLRIALNHERNLVNIALISGFNDYIGQILPSTVAGSSSVALLSEVRTNTELERQLAEGICSLGVSSYPSQGLISRMVVDEPFYLWVNGKNRLGRH